jgi:hypothetical protein
VIRIPCRVFGIIYADDEGILGGFERGTILAQPADLTDHIPRPGEKLLDIRIVSHDDPIPGCVAFDDLRSVIAAAYKHDGYDRKKN